MDIQNKAWGSYRQDPQEFLCNGEKAALPNELLSAYVRLKGFIWCDADCSLSADSYQLAKLAHCSVDAVGKLVRLFDRHPYKAGYITHADLWKQRQEQRRAYEQRVRACERSVEVRRGKQVERQA